MPLLVNVGLSRKASVDYQSTGASINITAELDATLLSQPQALQDAIDGLYQQARTALDRQAPGGAVSESATPKPASNGNGAARRPITERQRTAILAIARQAGVDAGVSARRNFGVELDQLTSSQASQLIDSLKA
jgi:hypothetical protein